MNGKTVPPWAAPALIVLVVLALILAGRKNEKAVENPLVDLLIIAVGVYAIGAVMRVLALKMNNPGLAAFFGAPAKQTTDITYQ